MANEFYTPLLSQAAGNASQLVASAPNALLDVYGKLGDWAMQQKLENQREQLQDVEQQRSIAAQERMQAQSIAAQERSQREQFAARRQEAELQTKAEQDRQDRTIQFEKGKMAYAAALEQGADPASALRWFDLAKVGQAADDHRDALRDGVLATGIFNTKVGSLGGQETGHLAAQVLDLQQKAIQAAKSGNLTGAQAAWKSSEDLLGNTELRSNLFKSSRSTLPVERQQGAEPFNPRTTAEFYQALEAGKSLSSAAVVGNGGNGWAGDLMQRYHVDAKQLPEDQQKLAYLMDRAAAPTEQGGKTRWDIGTAYGEALRQTYNNLLPTISPEDQKDEHKRALLMDDANDLVSAAQVVSKANGLGIDATVGILNGVVDKLSPNKENAPARKAALASVTDFVKESAQVAGGRGILLAPGFLENLSDIDKMTFSARGKEAFAQYVNDVSVLQLAQTIKLRGSDGSPIVFGGREKELAAASFETSPASVKTQTDLLVARRFVTREAEIGRRASGFDAVGNPIARVDQVWAKGQALVLRGWASAGSDEERNSVALSAAMQILPELEEISRQSGDGKTYAAEDIAKFLAGQMDAEGHAANVKAASAIPLNPATGVTDVRKQIQGAIQTENKNPGTLPYGTSDQLLSIDKQLAEFNKPSGKQPTTPEQEILDVQYGGSKETDLYKNTAARLQMTVRQFEGGVLHALDGDPQGLFRSGGGSVFDGDRNMLPMSSERRQSLMRRLGGLSVETKGLDLPPLRFVDVVGGEKLAELVDVANRTRMSEKNFMSSVRGMLRESLVPENIKVYDSKPVAGTVSTVQHTRNFDSYEILREPRTQVAPLVAQAVKILGIDNVSHQALVGESARSTLATDNLTIDRESFYAQHPELDPRLSRAAGRPAVAPVNEDQVMQQLYRSLYYATDNTMPLEKRVKAFAELRGISMKEAVAKIREEVALRQASASDRRAEAAWSRAQTALEKLHFDEGTPPPVVSQKDTGRPGSLQNATAVPVDPL